jgi:hypothetical protein
LAELRFTRGDEVELPKKPFGSSRGVVVHSIRNTHGIETTTVQRVVDGRPVHTVICADQLYRIGKARANPT